MVTVSLPLVPVILSVLLPSPLSSRLTVLSRRRLSSVSIAAKAAWDKREVRRLYIVSSFKKQCDCDCSVAAEMQRPLLINVRGVGVPRDDRRSNEKVRSLNRE